MESVQAQEGALMRLPWKREKRQRDAEAEIEEMLAFGKRCAARLRPGPSAVEHGDFLYGEDGLPE